MTQYEFNYALQNLLGVSQDFTSALPREATSEDGFRNSSQILQLTSRQFENYRKVAREALLAATQFGPRPEPVYYAITMEKVATPDIDLGGLSKFNDIREELTETQFPRKGSLFLNRDTSESWARRFPYGFTLWEPLPKNANKPTPPRGAQGAWPVSYTHLTLPTNREV